MVPWRPKIYIFMQKYMFYEQKKHSRNHQFLVVKRKKTHGITPAVRYFHYILVCFFCVVFISICFIFHSISCFFLNITRRAPPFFTPEYKVTKKHWQYSKRRNICFCAENKWQLFCSICYFYPHTHNTLSDNPQAQKNSSTEITPSLHHTHHRFAPFSEQVRHINLQEQGGAHITCNDSRKAYKGKPSTKHVCVTAWQCDS